MITQDEAIALARECGYGGQMITHEELTALCNLVRTKTLEDAAELLMEWGDIEQADDLRRMAKGE